MTSTNTTDAVGYSYNDTLNASVTTNAPDERPFSDTIVWISGTIIFSFLIIGFTLNLLTVLVIAKFPQIRNLFVLFIFSLCISDLISAIISPVFWYRRTLGFDEFAIPEFFCRFYWAADIMTSFATALHIMAFGFLRYFSIKFPFRYQRRTGEIAKICQIFIVSIWIVTFACGFVPFVIWFGVQERDHSSSAEHARWPVCTIDGDWMTPYKLYQKIAYPVFLCAPIVIVVFLSVLTAIEVFASTKSIKGKTSEMRRRRKDRQAVLQLMLIVVSFLIGYLPFTAYEFWSVEDHGKTSHIASVDYHFGLFEYFFIRFSECLNPIFYNLGSSRMRKCTKQFLRQLCCKEEKRRVSISVYTDITT